MYFVDNQGQLDPSVNIALETFLLKEKIVQPQDLGAWLLDQNLVKTFLKFRGGHQ